MPARSSLFGLFMRIKNGSMIWRGAHRAVVVHCRTAWQPDFNVSDAASTNYARQRRDQLSRGRRRPMVREWQWLEA